MTINIKKITSVDFVYAHKNNVQFHTVYMYILFECNHTVAQFLDITEAKLDRKLSYLVDLLTPTY